MSAQKEFAAKVAELIAQSKNLSLDARRKVLELLDAARKEIVARLADIDPNTFNAAQLNVMRQQIDSLMEQFRKNATAAIDGYEAKSFQLGAQTISSPLALVSAEGLGLGQIDQSALAIAQGYTADLVTGLSKDAAAKVNGTIQRAFLGGKQISDIIAQMGKALAGDKGFTGLFSAIGRKAEMITLNEVLRVHSLAAQARLEDAADRHPDLQKQWHHLAIALVPRPGHINADGQVVNVDEPFTVDGEELMFPRDPNGSPENTINCHCMMKPYFAPEALKPTAKHKGLLESLGISVTAA